MVIKTITRKVYKNNEGYFIILNNKKEKLDIYFLNSIPEYDKTYNKEGILTNVKLMI